MTELCVTLLSPVTTITRIPAVIHERMAFFTSSLGGSSIPTFELLKGINIRNKNDINSEHINFKALHITARLIINHPSFRELNNSTKYNNDMLFSVRSQTLSHS